MAYLVLALCAAYALFWGLGLVFSLKSDGKKALWIPALGLLAFIALAAASLMALLDAMANPPRLTVDKYLQIQKGMTTEEIEALIGPAATDEQIKTFEMDFYEISVPREVSSRLKDSTHADRVDAQVVLKIEGTPSKANNRDPDTLGSAAAGASGLMGLVISLKENGNETRIVEGVDWNYTDNMTVDAVAKALGAAIDAAPSWTAIGSPESDPSLILVSPELEANKGDACNDICTIQVASGPNRSVLARGVMDGNEQKFRGGLPEMFIKYWQEDGVVMDGDFHTADKMIIGGFIDKKLAGIDQSGIPLPLPEGGIAAAVVSAPGSAPAPAAKPEGGEPAPTPAPE